MLPSYFHWLYRETSVPAGLLHGNYWYLWVWIVIWRTKSSHMTFVVIVLIIKTTFAVWLLLQNGQVSSLALCAWHIFSLPKATIRWYYMHRHGPGVSKEESERCEFISHAILPCPSHVFFPATTECMQLRLRRVYKLIPSDKLSHLSRSFDVWLVDMAVNTPTFRYDQTAVMSLSHCSFNH